MQTLPPPSQTTSTQPYLSSFNLSNTNNLIFLHSTPLTPPTRATMCLKPMLPIPPMHTFTSHLTPLSTTNSLRETPQNSLKLSFRLTYKTHSLIIFISPDLNKNTQPPSLLFISQNHTHSPLFSHSITKQILSAWEKIHIPITLLLLPKLLTTYLHNT